MPSLATTYRFQQIDQKSFQTFMALPDLGLGHVRDYHGSKRMSILNVVILELALKYTLYHSRWLSGETHNAGDDVEPVGQGHGLQKLWEKLSTELGRRFWPRA